MMEVFLWEAILAEAAAGCKGRAAARPEAWPRSGSVPTAAGAAAKIPVQVTALAGAYFFSAETCAVEVCCLEVGAVKDVGVEDVCVKVGGVEDSSVEDSSVEDSDVEDCAEEAVGVKVSVMVPVVMVPLALGTVKEVPLTT